MTPEIVNTQKIYAAFINSDLTEGRGRQYPLAFSPCLATVERLGKGRNVQGCNADIEVVTVYRIRDDSGEKYYYPSIMEVSATKEDIAEEKRIKEGQVMQLLLAKFKAGEDLTKEEREKILNLLG